MIAILDTYIGNLDSDIYEALPEYLQDIIEDLSHYDRLGNGAFFSADGELNTGFFKKHELAYVRLGIWAEHARFYGIHKRFGSWRNFCEKALSRTNWQINNIINASRVVIELIKQGVTQLPNCTAQAALLWKLWKKRDPKYFRARPELLGEIWQKVTESRPAHQITAKAIEEVHEENSLIPKKQKIAIDEKLRDRLASAARERGLTIEEMIAAGLDAIEGKEPPEDPEEKIEPVSQRKLERWEQDVNALFEGDEPNLVPAYEKWCRENRVAIVPIGEVAIDGINTS